ncbi:MAG: ATP synthase F0 subunit B, partial [Thermoguttaceae bacterium]|nr:ATP synthase F0 subunit B [Thermoguttaceae bacterium]
WTAVVFLGLVAVLGRFAFGPIAKALDERERTEIERRAALEKANADARALLDEYRGKLDESAEEARRVVAEAKEAAAKERERALKDVEIATDGALQTLAAKSAELATNLAGKILKETIDPTRGERLLGKPSTNSLASSSRTKPNERNKDGASRFGGASLKKTNNETEN